MNERDDELERALRSALAHEAEQIEAGPGDYQHLQQRLSREPAGRRGGATWLPWLATAAAVSTIVGLSGAWLAGRPTDAANPAATSRAPQPSPSVLADGRPGVTVAADAPSPTPVGAVRALPVYWIGDAPLDGHGLYREFEQTSVVSAQRAVETMLTTQPMDGDYSSPWQPADVTVTIDPQLITVDLGAEAFAKPGVERAVAELGLQQLVYTVTAGAAAETGHDANLPVRILVDSRAGTTVWHGIALDEPITRDAGARAPLWITSPADGDSVPAGAVKVTVYGTAYEANALWVVYDTADRNRIVEQGQVTVGGMGTWAEGSFSPELGSGEYRIRVYTPDESDGTSGTGQDRGDDKVVTVR